MFKKKVKPVMLALAVFLSACGSTPQTTSSAGPSGTTTSGYQFDLYISPSNIKAGNSISATVTVWRNVGNVPAGNVTAYYAGDVSAATAVTSTGGVATITLTPLSGVTAGSQGVVTAMVENKSLSVAYYVTP
jgi:hypothetical protein